MTSKVNFLSKNFLFSISCSFEIYHEDANFNRIRKNLEGHWRQHNICFLPKKNLLFNLLRYNIIKTLGNNFVNLQIFDNKKYYLRDN